MIFTSFFVALLFAFSGAQTTDTDEIPFVISGYQGSSQEKVSNLLPHHVQNDAPLSFQLGPDTRGRSDIEIEQEERPFTGYFYPKPDKAFVLPEFKTLDASLESEGSSRTKRSPQRQQRPNRPLIYPPRPNYPSYYPQYPGYGRPNRPNRPGNNWNRPFPGALYSA